ncbi:MAG TPA: dihydrolipoamide acetyltransferase family protein [Anaerolineae bacterium]|nr:dihydrolipoamide acetyltransferase family protein [Anaerolineae bacterium]
MITEIILPKLGQTMEAGAIVEWLKQEGDPVQRGDVLFTVESDKAVLEVEAGVRGFVRKVLVPEGQNVPVLTAVGLITTTADESLEGWQAGGQPAQPATSEEALPVPAPGVPAPASRLVASPRARKAARERGVDLGQLRGSGSGPDGRIVECDVLAWLAARPKVTPVAARTAHHLGMELDAVSGTGPGGRITKGDVLSAAPAAAPAPASERSAERVHVTGLRRIIAERMSASHLATARVTLVTEADATALVEVREQLKASVAEEWGFAPGYSDLMGLIVARALRDLPYLNARLSTEPGGNGTDIEQLPTVNLGMAVDTERGLLVPVIRDADQKGLRAFGTEFRALADRARAGKSLPDDLAGGTFTITNLGMYDVDIFTPIINLPEAAILGLGRIQPKPVVRDGQVVVRQMWCLSLSFDHRLVDGAPAARFLQRIKRLVESPYLLVS